MAAEMADRRQTVRLTSTHYKSEGACSVLVFSSILSIYRSPEGTFSTQSYNAVSRIRAGNTEALQK